MSISMEDVPAAAAAENHAAAAGERTLHELVPMYRRSQSTAVDFEAVVERCRTHPEEASRPYDEDRFSDFSVLHILMMYTPPLEAVRAVVEACPSAVTKEGNCWNHPLHKAIMNNVSPDIIRILVAACFGEQGNYRLMVGGITHFFRSMVVSFCGIESETFRAILESVPSNMIAADDMDDMTANLVRQYFRREIRDAWTDEKQNDTWDILQQVLGFVTHGTFDRQMLSERPRCYLQAIFEALAHNYVGWQQEALLNFLEETRSRDPSQFCARNSVGRLPLHVLLSPKRKVFFPAGMEVKIKFVLGEFSEAAQIPDPLTGELPLHTALKAGFPYEDLLAAEPRTLRTRNATDRLYPFEAAMLHLAGPIESRKLEQYCLDAAYTILREDPALLGIRGASTPRPHAHGSTSATAGTSPGIKSVADSPEAKRRREN